MGLDDRLERMLVGPMVWMSTLHAAAEVWRSRADRKRGIDASELEAPEDARRRLSPALRQVEELTFQMGALQVAMNESLDERSMLVARFDLLMIVNRCAQLLEDVHRRLLSLYSDSDEDLIEEVRQLAGRCRACVEAEDPAPPIDDLFRTCASVRSTMLERGF